MKLYICTLRASSAAGKSKDHSRKTDWNLLVSSGLIPCTTLDRSTQCPISSSDLVSVLIPVTLLALPLVLAEDVGKEAWFLPPQDVKCITVCPNEEAFPHMIPLPCFQGSDPLFNDCNNLWDSENCPTQLPPFTFHYWERDSGKNTGN